MLLSFLINKAPTRLLLLLRDCCRSRYKQCLLNSIIESRRRFSNKAKDSKRSAETTTIVFSSCGYGGITDRFKAMVSLYDFCREEEINFRICSKRPFDFEYFFQPASYDWRISEDLLIEAINNKQTYQAWLTSGGKCGDDEWGGIKYSIKKLIETHRYSYIIIHASSPYGHPKFAETFHELFKPTEAFSSNIEHYRSIFGEYYSVSFRFVNLLGDSNEKVVGYHAISEEERTQMINKCISLMEGLMEEKANRNILITTDSFNFTQIIKAKAYPNVFLIEGEPMHHHIGFSDNISNKEIEKSLIEFMLISYAKKAFQIQVGKMYESKFPKWAASLNAVPYILINAD